MKGTFDLSSMPGETSLKGSDHKKAYIGLLVLLMLLIVALSITVGVLSKENREYNQRLEGNGINGHNESYKQKECMTPECVTFSAEMLSRMNLSADPCDDFYQYACGRYADPESRAPHENAMASFDLPDQLINQQIAHLLTSPGLQYRGQNSTAVRKAKKFYTVCIEDTNNDEVGKASLLNLIKDLNFWPLSSLQNFGIGLQNQTSWNQRTWNLDDAIIKSQTFGFDALMTLGTYPDPRKTGVHVLAMISSGLLGGYADYYTSSDMEANYKDLIEYVLQIIYGHSNRANYTLWAQKIWNFERSLSTIYPTHLDLMSFDHPSSIVKIGDLQRNVSYMNLTYILNQIYNNSGQVITNETEILVGTSRYFSDLSQVISSLGRDTNGVMASYIVWNAVFRMLNYAGNSLRVAIKNFSKKALGVSSLSIISSEFRTKVSTFRLSLPKWKNCISRTVDALGFAVGALHSEKFFNKEDKMRIHDALQTTIDEFINSLEYATWLSDTTRERAKEKARSVEWQIGYPEIFNNRAILDQYYREFSAKSILFENILEQKRFERKIDVDKYGKPVDRTEWLMKPTEVNAYYYAPFNQIVVLGGILHRPPYDRRYPSSLFFGGLGSILGHELIHGFDTNGRKYDGRGNEADWWDFTSNSEYLNRSECFMKQYNESKFQGHDVDGELTLAENIADNGGVKLAYSAYQDSVKGREMSKTFKQILPGLDLTENKQFFVAYAQLWCVNMDDASAAYLIKVDDHSPGPLRVNEVLRNTREFSEAFSCPDTSKMNPSKRCSLW